MKWNEDEGGFELWATGHVSTCDDASVLFAYGTMILGTVSPDFFFLSCKNQLTLYNQVDFAVRLSLEL